MPVYRSLPITISGTSLVISSAQVLFGNGTAAAPSMSFSAETNLGIFRNSAGSPAMSFTTSGVGRAHITNNGIVIGNQPFTSSNPVGGLINATDAGGTNIAGVNLQIRAGSSTGNAAGGALIFQTSAAGVSGTATNTPTERMRITSNGEVLAGTATVPTGSRFVFDTTSTGHAMRLAGDTLATFLLEDKGVADASKPFQYLQSDGGALIFGNADRSGTATAGSTARMTIKANGQVRFIPLAADPASAEAGDVYYNSATNKLRVYNGTAWVDLH